MCKFHKDVARAIATDPVTDQFDPGKYSVTLLALAAFRLEQYMPPMHSCDGFVPAEMATDEAAAAFAASGLQTTDAVIDAYAAANLPALRAALDATAGAHTLTLQGLGIPDMITRDGYKHCDKMAADPTQSGPFLDEALVELFDGYDDAGKTLAHGPLTLAAAAHKPEFERLRAAAADFMARPGVTDILKRMFEHSVARIFQNAAADLAAGRGFDQTDGCVMCGHGSRAEHKTEHSAATEQPQADKNVKSLSSVFVSCARCARDGVGGAAVSHIGCIVTPLVAGAFGVAVSGPLLAGIMMVTAPLVAVGATWGLDRLRGQKSSGLKLAGSAAIAVAMAMVISSLTGGHDHHAAAHAPDSPVVHQHHHGHHPAPGQ